MGEVHEFLRVLRHRLVVITLLTIVGVGVAAVWLSQTPTHYVATTRLFISAGTSTSQYDAQQGGIYAQDRVVSYKDLINSRVLAQRTIDALSLNTDADTLASNVTSVTVPNSAVMDVSIAADSPQAAKDTANGLANQFVSMAATLETPPDGSAPVVRVNIIDTADLGTKARVLPDALIYFLGGLIGFIIGLMVAFLIEKFSGRVRDRIDVERATGEPPAAELPASRDELLSASRPESIEATHRLRLIAAGSNVVAITGLPGRSATSTRAFAAAAATRLASSLGTDEKSTALVVLDSDPGVAARVGLDIRGQQSGGSAVSLRWTLSEHTDPDGLIDPRAIAEELQRLQEEFEYVVVLVPPLSDSAQAAAVAAAVQGVVAVGIYGRSNLRDIKAHQAELLRVGATSLGFSFVKRRPVIDGSGITGRGRRTAQRSATSASTKVTRSAQAHHSHAMTVRNDGMIGTASRIRRRFGFAT